MSLEITVTKMLEKEIDKYADKMLKITKQEAHQKTGALRDSIRKEKKKYGYKIGVDSDVLKADSRNIGHIDYSPHYYYGHGGYTIVPKNKKALRWEDSTGVHFAKKVHIPASSGDPFLERAIARRPKIK